MTAASALDEFQGFARAATPRLFRSALLMSGDWHLSEDLVQTALGKIFSSWSRARRADNLEAYAHTVLMRTYLSHRRLRRSSEHPVAALPELSTATATAPDTALRVTLLAALAELPPRDRAVVVLPGFPARVDSVSATVGSPVTAGVMTLSAGELLVQGSLQERQKGLVRSGQRVEILDERSGTTVPGKVRSVAETLGAGKQQDGTSAEGEDAEPAPSVPEGYAIVVEPDEPLDSALAGLEVRLTVEAGSTDGEALVVPVTAVSVGPDGKSAVTVVAAAGTQRRVQVRAGTQGDGYVEVVPVEGGRLEPGDLVVTGVRQADASGGGGA